MDIKPFIFGLLFVILLVVLFNPPGGGGGGAHGDHGKPGGKEHKH